MFSTIRHIVRKEFIQLLRDRRMFMPLFMAPVIQLILFGYAATVDIKHISLAVVDYDRTQESRALVSSFIESGYFELKAEPDSSPAVDRLLQTGKVQAALVLPSDFARQLKSGRNSPLQIVIDGTDANSATIIQNYVSLILAKYAQAIVTEMMMRRPEGMILLEPRVWYNPELKSSVWMVPGVVSLILLLTTLILTSMAITRERELGTLEQLIVSPIKPIELILGKTIPFVIVGFCDVILVLVAGKLVFNIPIRGNLAFLLACALVFILTTLGLGLFVSTVSRTQGQVMMTALFFMMPAMLLSGVFSPIEGMPQIVQYLTYINPLRYFGRIVRGILLKGNGFSILWPDLLVLFIMGIITIVLSSLRFKKHLE